MIVADRANAAVGGGTRSPLTFLYGLIAVALAVVVFVALERASGHSFGGNSDGATVVLEGFSISHGHLALNGWDLSFDSFWSVDALVYALVIVVTGLRHDLLHVVPALIALATIGLGVVIAVDRRRGFAAVFSVLLLLAILGVPNPELSFFFLQGPWHIGTALWCLIAFVALSRGRIRWGWAIAVLFLAAGLLGDLQTAILGVLPCFFAGVLAAVRRRSLREGVPAVTAAIASVAVAALVRQVTVRVGTYAIAHSATKAHFSQYPANIKNVVHWGAGLFGVGWIPIGPTPALSSDEESALSTPQQFLHGVLLALVVLGVLIALVSLVHGLVTGRQLLPDQDGAYRLDDFLFLGTGGSVALFVYLCPNGNGDYARYLLAAVLFGTILAARMLGRSVGAVDHRLVLQGVTGGLLIVAVFAVTGFIVDLRTPTAAQPVTQLGAFLKAHHLTLGIGDYWSSSITTVVSDGKVTVRPVIPNAAGELQRYGRQSDVAWYAGKQFQFLVYDLARPWRGVDTTSATTSFGPPLHTYAVGTYRVLTWSAPVTVSAVGYSRS